MTPRKRLEYWFQGAESKLGLKYEGIDPIITIYEDDITGRELEFCNLNYKMTFVKSSSGWDIIHNTYSNENLCRLFNRNFRDSDEFHDFMHDVELLTQLCTKPYDELKLYLDSI